jgi:uncharacterized Zn-finger protein
MEAIFKRVVFIDEWVAPQENSVDLFFLRLLRLNLSFLPCPTDCFVNYALGYRFEATGRELHLIDSNDMYCQTALTLPSTGHPRLFIELLSPRFVPEVNPSPMELLRVEACVRKAAAVWTHFFESMSD